MFLFGRRRYGQTKREITILDGNRPENDTIANYFPATFSLKFKGSFTNILYFLPISNTGKVVALVESPTQGNLYALCLYSGISVTATTDDTVSPVYCAGGGGTENTTIGFDYTKTLRLVYGD